MEYLSFGRVKVVLAAFGRVDSRESYLCLFAIGKNCDRVAVRDPDHLSRLSESGETQKEKQKICLGHGGNNSAL